MSKHLNKIEVLEVTLVFFDCVDELRTEALKEFDNCWLYFQKFNNSCKKISIFLQKLYKDKDILLKKKAEVIKKFQFLQKEVKIAETQMDSKYNAFLVRPFGTLSTFYKTFESEINRGFYKNCGEVYMANILKQQKGFEKFISTFNEELVKMRKDQEEKRYLMNFMITRIQEKINYYADK